MSKQKETSTSGVLLCTTSPSNAQTVLPPFKGQAPPSKWEVSKGITGTPPGIYEATVVLSKLQWGKSSNNAARPLAAFF